MPKPQGLRVSLRRAEGKERPVPLVGPVEKGPVVGRVQAEVICARPAWEEAGSE